MKYDGITTKPELDDLYHWSFGWKKKDHKYISRKRGKNGKWQYTYSQIRQRVRKITDKIDKDHDGIINLFDSKNNQTSALKHDPRYHYKYYKKVMGPNGNWIYFYSQEAYERYSQRQQNLDKLGLDTNWSLLDVPLLSQKPSPLYAAYKTDVGTDLGNCTTCTIAMDMRMRGYDVRSRSDIDGRPLSDMLRCYDGFEDKDYNELMMESVWTLDKTIAGSKEYRGGNDYEQSEMARADLENTIKDRGGDDQFGFIQIDWTDAETGKITGGHVFNYVVKDGDVTFYESQKDEYANSNGGTADINWYLLNSMYTTEAGKSNDSYAYYGSNIHIFRTDDKELTRNATNYVSYSPIEDVDKDISYFDYWYKPTEKELGLHVHDEDYWKKKW